MYAGHFDFDHPLIWTLPGLLSAAECARVIDSAAGGEWLPATVNSAAGRVVEAHIRDNTVAVLRDPALGRWPFERVAPHAPAQMTAEDGARGHRVPVRIAGLFVPLRIYRYEAGQHFGLHRDQSYAGEDGTRSLLTCMVYLNDDFEGGETDFPEQGRAI